MKGGTCLRAVAERLSNRLQTFVVKATKTNERILRVRIKHTLGSISLVAIYTPNEK